LDSLASHYKNFHPRSISSSLCPPPSDGDGDGDEGSAENVGERETSEEGAITPAMLNPFVCYEKQGF